MSVRVNLMTKTIDKKSEEAKREIKTHKDLDKPKSYDDFIKNIAKSFKIKNKKSITLILKTIDDDEIGINDQEDLDDNIGELKEFNVFLEEGEQGPVEIETEDPPKKQITIKEKKGGDKVDESDDDNSEKDKTLDDLKIDVNLDISDKEIENIIDSQFKPIPEEQNITLDEIKDYNIDTNKKSDEVVQEFQKLFDSRIIKIVSQKSKVMIESLTELINNYSQSQIKNLEELNQNTSELKQGFSTLIENTNEMNEHMGKLKNQVVNGGGLQFSNLANDKRNDKYGGQDMLEIEDDNEDNNKKIQIMNGTISKNELVNSCKFITIDNIKVKNIGRQAFKNLYFVKDEKESSEDIIFVGNDKSNKIHKLSLDGEFNPSEETNHSFNLKINYPKVNYNYNLFIYVREKENGPNLSNSLKIVINVKESDEDRIKKEQEEEEKKKQEELKKQEEERKKQEELKKKQEEEERKKQEELKKRQEEEKRKQEEEQKKIDSLFDKLNEEFNSKLQKEEIVQKIKEYDFDEEKIKEYIKKKIGDNNNIDYQGLNKDEVENLYNELDQEFNLSSIMNKEEVIAKIIELKCDRDSLNDWIFEKL